MPLTGVSSMFNFDASSADTIPVSQQQFILPKEVSPTTTAPLDQTQTGFIGLVFPTKDSKETGKLIADLAERNSISVKFSSVSPNYVHINKTRDRSGIAMINYAQDGKRTNELTVEELRAQGARYNENYVFNYIDAVKPEPVIAMPESYAQLMPYSATSWISSIITLTAGKPVSRRFTGKPLIILDLNADETGIVYAIWAFATFEAIIPTQNPSTHAGIWPGTTTPGALQQGGFIQTMLDVGSSLLNIIGVLGKTTVFFYQDGTYKIKHAGDTLTPFEKERSEYILTVNRQAELGMLLSRPRSRITSKVKYATKQKNKHQAKRNAPAKRKPRNNQ
jgi:hypothetical protein